MAQGILRGYRFEREADEGIFKVLTCVADVRFDRDGNLESWSATARHRNLKGAKKMAAEDCLRLFARDPASFKTCKPPLTLLCSPLT